MAFTSLLSALSSLAAWIAVVSANIRGVEGVTYLVGGVFETPPIKFARCRRRARSTSVGMYAARKERFTVGVQEKRVLEVLVLVVVLVVEANVNT